MKPTFMQKNNVGNYLRLQSLLFESANLYAKSDYTNLTSAGPAARPFNTLAPMKLP